MIKLKSLFRRGQGSSSNSSKHSNNRNKSQSATSLNSVVDTEQHKKQQTAQLQLQYHQQHQYNHNQQQHQHQHQHQQQHHQQQHSPLSTPPPQHDPQQPALYTKFYPNVDATSERGVDVGGVGFGERLAAAQQTARNDGTQGLQPEPYNSHTLPNKKPSVKKGHKQPKQLPTSQTSPKSSPESDTANVNDLSPTSNVMSATTAATAAASTKLSHNNHTAATAAAYNEDGIYQHYQVPAQLQQQQQQQQQPQTHHHQQHHHHQHQHQQQQPNSINKTDDNFYIQHQQIVDKEQHHLQHHLKQQQQQQQQLLQQHQKQLLEANNKMQELHAQLDRLSREKLQLETRIEELLPYQSEVSQLQAELSKMQSQYEKSQLEIANLKYENESLRHRLHDVSNSPLSDAEKHQIIQDSQRLHSSAPASIVLPGASLSMAATAATTTLPTIATTMTTSTNSNSNNLLHTSLPEGEAAAALGTPSCLTPDWDKHSSSSEISVACLQDKIIQMEETHYSTNEELQATLQELADLQSQLSDAQAENERLAEEKDVLFQSLCRQTEKLGESRTQITTLQELLLRDAKQTEQAGSSERENKLLDLIKTAQEERETSLVRQEELNKELQDLRQSLDLTNKENARFKERISLLDSTIDAATAERKQIELQLQQAKDEISQRSIEINRLTTLLENARSKIEELEQDLARGEKTDLSDLLDAARKEKDALEERVAELQDQFSRSQAETQRLKDQLSVANEECKVAKNNAKCAVSHLEYRLEQLQQEKDKLSADYQQLAESTAEIQIQSKCHLEDKTQLQNLLSETQKHLGDVERKLSEKEEQLEKELELRKQEAEEWKQFQSDLLMTVRVANDFKTEALSEREQLVIDNKTQKEKIRLLEQQIEKLTKQQLQQNETQQSVLSTVQQEMASRRNKIASGSNFNRQDSRLSVKTLIETIENNKQNLKTEAETETQLGSTTSTPDITPNTMPILGSTNYGSNGSANTEWTDNLHLPVISFGGNNSGSSSSLATTPQSTTTPLATTTTNSTTITLNAKGREHQLQQQQSQQQSSSQQTSSPSSLVNSLNFSSLNQSTSIMTKSATSVSERKDPLNMLAKNGGSKRNALLKWCQNKTVGYRNIDITNFSSSWNDGLAFCAILHSYLPDSIPYDTLTPANKRQNFSLAFAAAESVGIPTTLNINDMCQIERPDWMQVMSYVTAIYKHFET